MSLVSSLEKPSSDPAKWPAVVNCKIKNAGNLIKGGSTEMKPNGQYKIVEIKWNTSSTGPVPLLYESGKSGKAPDLYMALPGDGNKITDKIIKKDPQTGETSKRYLSWGDVERGSEIEAVIRVGNPWKTPMGISSNFEIVEAVFYPPAPKSSTSFSGKRFIEDPSDQELMGMQPDETSAESPSPAQQEPGAGYVPTFDDDDEGVADTSASEARASADVDLVKEETKEFASPVKEKEESSQSAPGAPTKKRKTKNADE